MPAIVAFETLTDLFLNLTKKYEKSPKTAFAYKPAPDAEYKSVTWDTVKEDVTSVASYLLQQGVDKGDRVAILSENRYEWAVVDLAILMVGGINVSLYTRQISVNTFCRIPNQKFSLSQQAFSLKRLFRFSITARI